MNYFGWGVNRTYCDVLEEMRKCYETRNFSSFMGLIEELQTYGNRMEAALGDGNDVQEINEEKHKVKKEYKALVKELEEMIKVIDELKLKKADKERFFAHYDKAKDLTN